MPDRSSEPRYDLVEMKYRDEGDSLVSASRLNPLPTEIVASPPVAGFRAKNITSQATFPLKAGKGLLHSIVINKATASGVIAFYDNATTAVAGDLLGTITLPGTLLANQFVLFYDIELQNGLTVVTSGATCDITVTFR